MTDTCTPPQASMLPTWIYPSTCRDAQARLLAAVRGTDQSVQQCASLDTATRASWGDFYAAAVEFALADPGLFGLGARMDQVQAYGFALCQWQDKIQAASCTLTVPQYNPEAPSSDNFVKAVQYGSVAAVAVAGAWLLGKLIELLPKPAR
jgi:hypothetical protein